MIVNSIHELIDELDKAMISDELETYFYEEDGLTYFKGEIATELDEAASGLLIKASGSPDYGRMSELKDLSKGKYYVTPGETDSFGWLTGCLHTPRGILVYG